MCFPMVHHGFSISWGVIPHFQPKNAWADRRMRRPWLDGPHWDERRGMVGLGFVLLNIVGSPQITHIIYIHNDNNNDNNII